MINLVAKVTVTGAFNVAVFLDANADALASVAGWEEVRDALYALANDTDAIVTYDE